MGASESTTRRATHARRVQPLGPYVCTSCVAPILPILLPGETAPPAGAPLYCERCSLGDLRSAGSAIDTLAMLLDALENGPAPAEP